MFPDLVWYHIDTKSEKKQPLKKEKGRGKFANSLEEKAHSIPINPALRNHISKLKARTRNERMLFPYYNQLAESRSFRQNDFVTDPETLDMNTLPEMDAIYPTFDPSSPGTTTTPTYNPTPDTNNPPVTNPTTNPPVTNPTTSPVTNPTTSPVTNPTTSPVTNPTTSPVTNPPTNPAMGGGGGGGPTTSSSSGNSWCVASQSASENVLQVGLDYACGYGGADCSAIQQGGSCFNPDTVRDHASYAFNSYYQKNPVPTSCDFGGAAVVTTTDPSTSACQFPSSSTSSSTTTPPTMGSPSAPTGYGQAPPFDNSPPSFGTSPPSAFGSSPPDYSDSSSTSIALPSSTSICLITSFVYFKFLRP